jgi:hypothetical protein
MRKKTKTIKIMSCLQCPHHGIERDPSSGDSFDWYDTSLVCRLADAPKEEESLRILAFEKPGRAIVCCSRNPNAEYKRDGEPIPKWCPL